jgi:hypothetical protein
MSNSLRQWRNSVTARQLTLSLRSFEISDRRDLSIGLALGIIILTFAMLFSGRETLTLSRHALGLVKPYHEANIDFDIDDTSYLICLVISETIECLYSANLPTIRFDRKNLECSIDRYLGLCYPLLAQLYDLCEINHELSCGFPGDLSEIMKRLDCICTVVYEWQPIVPPQFLDQYAEEEVINILAQAKCFRLALLIISHRLRHPYGVRDQEAMFLADEILSELGLALQITRHSVKVTDMCMVTAMLEQTSLEDRKKSLDRVEGIRHFGKNFRQAIKRHLSTFWDARDRTTGIYWFHLSQFFK